ncbi:MAG TPA: hypothetical protein GX712_04080 [Bacteroidales bacterium]|jgi:hypothetical protein|nr:hypothetical protein [Bacteroidales bacterium]
MPMIRCLKNTIVSRTELIYPLFVSIIGYLIINNLEGLSGAILIGLFLYLPLILFNPTVNLYHLVFYVANERMFIIDGFSMGLIAIYIILLFSKTLLLEKLKVNKSLVFLGLFMLILMLLKGVVQSTSPIDTEIIRHVFNLYIFMSLVKNNRHNINEFSLNLGSWFCFGVFVATFIGIYDSFSRTSEILTSNFFRLIPVNQDPNYYGVAVTLAISVLIVKLSLGTVKNNKLIFYMVLFFAFGFMTQSRAFLITSIINIILLLIVFSKQKVNHKFSILIALVLASLIGYPLGLFNIFERSIGRFRYAGLKDVRLILWREYIEILTTDVKNFFFGIGKRYDLTTIRLAPHNFLIGSWAYYGCFLTSMIISSYYFIYYKFKTINVSKRWKLYYYLLFLVVFIGYSFLDGIIDNLFFYGIALSLTNTYLLEQSKKV